METGLWWAARAPLPRFLGGTLPAAAIVQRKTVTDVGAAIVASVPVTMSEVAMVYDWRTLGRVHKVYLYGGAAFLLETFLVLPLAHTEAWMNTARLLEHLTG